MKTEQTINYIVIFGDRRLKKLVQRGKVNYNEEIYQIASKLPSIKEAIYRIEIGADDYPHDLPRLKKLYRNTCKELYRAIKVANRKEVK